MVQPAIFELGPTGMTGCKPTFVNKWKNDRVDALNEVRKLGMNSRAGFFFPFAADFVSSGKTGLFCLQYPTKHITQSTKSLLIVDQCF